MRWSRVRNVLRTHTFFNAISVLLQYYSHFNLGPKSNDKASGYGMTFYLVPGYQHDIFSLFISRRSHSLFAIKVKQYLKYSLGISTYTS